MRQRYCRHCNDWHDMEAWPHAPEVRARSHLNAPSIIGDGMEPVQAMTDGSWHDSKSSIRANYKRFNVTEVGNDSSVLNPKSFVKPKPDRKAIKAAVGKAFSRVGLGS